MQADACGAVGGGAGSEVKRSDAPRYSLFRVFPVVEPPSNWDNGSDKVPNLRILELVLQVVTDFVCIVPTPFQQC
ncbi:MAG: hypothetical protein CL859_11645 [Cyanobium sp. ARS6]|nr:hypothetical protein [Cyanobium sp. ARS6]